MLELNSTFFYQIINFWLIILVLYVLLFRPLCHRLRTRRDEIDGNLKEARRREEEVETSINDYQQKIHVARRAANDVVTAVLQEGAEAQRQQLETARQQATERLAEARAEIVAESEQAGRQIAEEAQRLSVLIAEKVLGRRVA